MFGSLLGLLAALLLEVEVGHDRFGGSYRRSDLGYGLAGLALVQPGLVVVVDGEGGYLFFDLG